MRPGGRRVNRGRWVLWGAPWGSLGSLECVLGIVRFIRTVELIWVRLVGRKVHLGTLGCALGVVRFVRGHRGNWGSHLG